MKVDVVIIGINTQDTLENCIQTVLQSHFPAEALTIFYVDGGSKDKSVAIAKKFPQVKTIELHPLHPTPGLGRNAGWKEGSSPFIQFLDSDMEVDSQWLGKAVAAMEADETIGAVRGLCKEKFPERSIFNWIVDQEWNDSPGVCQTFGGDVMLRRTVLEETGGYNDKLVGGEDPELSLRVRETEWKILMLDEPQAKHDLAMYNLGQYWKRAYRTGYAYAEVYNMHKHQGSFWKREVLRIVVRGGLAVVFTLLGLLWCWAFLIPAALLLFYPLLRAGKLGFAYALHCAVVVIPQFFGVAGYYLKGKRQKAKGKNAAA